MSPLRGEEFTGRTVEEAIERGLRSLGRKRTDVDIEVLEKGKPANVLGMGGDDARVLLSYQEDAVAEPEPTVDEAEVPRHSPAERAAARDEDEAPPAFAEDLAQGATILRDLLARMGVEAEVTYGEQSREDGLDVSGGELGALIGRGGENLVALQQIVSAITSKRVGRSVHVAVDIEGYRRRREDQLREMASRVAARVKATGSAVTLEPMLAYERRIVHLVVQETGGVRTESVGLEPNRRVVISSTAPGARGPMRRPAGGFRRPYGGGGGGFGGPRRSFGGPRPGGYRPRPDR
ncbi:MAG: protein jag [Chloroflexi bacterium]|nr:MAG: protein jag [Chloroflexota bacterium]TMB78934.1 MAG: protein jag [Chloroflexota bacterium]TMB94489.1 MAG: protein jag [Chloroflexota bacterium]TMC30388.1 MAG: protein jag [Chloroflexota bacterium]TMC32751.1 MAG: protein jag [Chloroflexota bacterium]